MTEPNPSSTPENENQSASPKVGRMLRIAGGCALALGLVVFIVFILRQQPAAGAIDGNSAAGENAGAGQALAPQAEEQALQATRPPLELLPPFATISTTGLLLPPDLAGFSLGIPRRLEVDTSIPARPRSEVITYTVKTGDNLFDIATKFGLEPETMLLGNEDTLEDNPHLLSPGMVLNILPEDGAYYQWKEGDTIEGVANHYRVSPQDILDYIGNDIDLTAEDGAYGLVAGDWVIIPGGTREFIDWGPPAISRGNPAVAAYYGPGNCGAIGSGAVGTGSFVWPTVERRISGYHYSSIHRGIDIGGAMGNAIFASDSGVVVYAGWSNYGYGNLIVIDHGGGWQTAYAHLDTIGVTCGQSVFQGGYIGGMGSTGNSSGPHLHFELFYNGTKPNPMDYVY